MGQDVATPPLDAAFREQVFTSICTLLPRVVQKEMPLIGEETRLMADIGMRSATMLELLLELEDALEIQIEVEDIDEGSMTSVGDLANYVAGHSVIED